MARRSSKSSVAGKRASKKRKAGRPRNAARGSASDAETLKGALRAARAAAGLSQVEAARRIGVHAVTLYTWEKTGRPELPRDANVLRAARVYGTSAASLRAGGVAPIGSDGAMPAPKPRRGRPPKNRDGDAMPAAPTKRVGRRRRRVGTANGSVAGVSTASTAVMRASPHDGAGARHLVARAVEVPRSVYGRVFRALADLADHSSLDIAELAAAQQALTSPALLDTFAALSNEPMSEADMLTAIDASAAAVSMFVAKRARR
ncbi:MAG: helix-turn-helix transcriptional regulator [Gemmatimonadaceae bacterium]